MRRWQPVGLVLLLLGSTWLSAGVTAPGWVVQQAAVKPLTESVDAPASLLYGRTEVFRDGDRIVLRRRFVYRILSAEGLPWGRLIVMYDGRSSVEGVRGWRLDSNGAPLEELEKDHIKHVAGNVYFADDSRQLIATFKNVEKGDIVAFEYEARRSAFFDDIYLPLGRGIEVVHEEVSVPEEARAKVLNDPTGLVKRQQNTFLLENRPLYRAEPDMPPAADRTPTLAISFSPAGSSWSSFAARFWQLTSSALRVDAPTLARADKVIPFTNPEQYIKDVTRFAASDINYVDIELGEGGYIPHSCSFVLDHRYGDCKDKVFLAAALLRGHGIVAYPVLAKPREFGRVVPEFVGNQFNHVVLAIQLDGTTAHLANTEVDGHPYLLVDVTDRFTRPPYLPQSLEGTRGLLAREDGGELITLPTSAASDNETRYEIEAALRSDGSAAAEITEIKTGQSAFSEVAFRDRLTQSNEAQEYRSWIQRVIPGAVLSAHSFSRQPAEVRTTYSVTMPRYALRTADGFYVLPDPMTSNKRNPFRRHSRRWDLRFAKRRTVRTRVHWTWPGDIELVSLPETSRLSTPYFDCDRSSKREGRGVTLEYRLVWKVTHVPAADYAAFRKAYRSYIRLLRATFVVGSKPHSPVPGS